MNFAFSEEQDEFREMLRRFFEEKAPSAEVRQMMASPQGFDADLWKQMAVELGLQGVHLPEEVGGQGAGFLELGIVLEEMGRVVLPSPFLSSVVLAAGSIRHAGSEAEQASLLAAIASGEAIHTLAWAENGSAWDLDGIATTATPDGDTLVLDGVKTSVTDAGAAGAFVVAARLPGSTGRDGITLAVVERDADGVTIEEVESLDPTRQHGTLRLQGVRATPLGTPGQAADALERTALEGCVALSAELIGIAQRSLEMAVEYAKVRLQFARPIGSFQAIKHKAARDPHRGRACALRGVLVVVGRGSGSVTARRGRASCEGEHGRCRASRDDRERADPRRHRLHLGARRAPLPEARAFRRHPARRRDRASRGAGGRALRLGAPRLRR